jgi:hypothetical protein
LPFLPVGAVEGRTATMSCPYLEEVVMVFCRAYPVKKPVPRSRSTTACPCMSDGFERCPFFQEVTARADAVVGEEREVPR